MHLDHKIDIRGYAIQSEVHLSCDLKKSQLSPVVAVAMTILDYKWEMTR